MIELLVSSLIGYSIVAAMVLYVSYAFFLHNLNKSPRALITCALLLVGLIQLQLGHREFFISQTDPLASPGYRVWLFLVPAMFYLFSRSILFDENRSDPSMVLHLLPVALPFLLRIEVAVSILFCIGTGYSLWLTHIIYGLKSSRSLSRYELFFLVLFSGLAIGVLLLGFAMPYIDVAYFYYFYAVAIGSAMVLVVGALVSFPELLAELAAAAKASYSASTLGEIDIDARKTELVRLMEVDELYRQETLDLSMLADAVDLSSHQLSELINTEFGVSFSRFVRQYRIEEAIRLLQAEPEASVLSISLDVGFRSQSNFYAAFKEITGQSPGNYRA